MSDYPRILIISNNCLSKTGSNGRTMANLLKGYPKEKIAQFFIQKATPDFEVCDNYYRVTDIDAISAFIKGKTVGLQIRAESIEEKPRQGKSGKISKKYKTPLHMLFREIIWKSKRWQGDSFPAWVEEFGPEVILLQAGDNAFMFKLATDLAKKKKIPLIIYNTESYFFKKRNYMRGGGITALFYPLFRWQFKRQFIKSMNYASCAVYNCELLKQDYDKCFDGSSYVIYNSTDIATKEKSEMNNPPVVTYLGNLGVGRYESLIEIANAMQTINPEYKLDIYGKMHAGEIKNAILGCSAISYKGFVQYEEVVKVINSSDILVHAENFSEFCREDLKYAFSTKIADCLKSGAVFFNYAPKELASTQYLLNNDVACVVTEKEKLLEALSTVINDKAYRERLVSRAVKLAEENHNSQKNGEHMAEIVRSVVHEGIAG